MRRSNEAARQHVGRLAGVLGTKITQNAKTESGD